MRSYRKRPIAHQARQLTAESYRGLIDVLTVEQFAAGGEAPDGTAFLEIRTLEGIMRASEGDWIVWGIKGEVWPVRADIFAETYEPVPDDEDSCAAGEEPSAPASSDLTVKRLRAANRRVRSVLIANADRLSTPFTDDPDKNPWDTFVRPAMHQLQRAVNAAAAALAEADGPIAEARTEERPRCPHCQMPHDLTPGNLPAAMCASVRQRIAKAERLHTEGDHSLCARVDCDALRTQATAEEQPAKPETDCNVGPGWYEVINPRNATTCIAMVYDDGSLYLPEGDALTSEEFAFAAARGNAHRLVRADEVKPAAGARQDGAQPS